MNETVAIINTIIALFTILDKRSKETAEVQAALCDLDNNVNVQNVMGEAGWAQGFKTITGVVAYTDESL